MNATEKDVVTDTAEFTLGKNIDFGYRGARIGHRAIIGDDVVLGGATNGCVSAGIIIGQGAFIGKAARVLGWRVAPFSIIGEGAEVEGLPGSCEGGETLKLKVGSHARLRLWVFRYPAGAEIEIGEGAEVELHRGDGASEFFPTLMHVGAGAVVHALVDGRAAPEIRVGAGAKVGKGTLLLADVPAGHTVLPGSTVDKNTVFLGNEHGTVTVTSSGADCFGGVSEKDVLVAYARELHAARVRASEAEAAKAKADAARAQAETDAEKARRAAECAEQRARSAEGRLEKSEGSARYYEQEVSDLHDRASAVLETCRRSRAKVARRIEQIFREEE